MAKYLEKKAESLEKLNCNLASETARTADCQNDQVNSWKRIVCIKVSNYPLTYAYSVHLFLTELQQT